jgi:hypothetical protein
MLKVPFFEGKEGENLLFWFKEVELAFEAGLIKDERVRVTFAMSKLSGRAKNWVLAKETTYPGVFATWTQLQKDLSTTFQPPNVAFRQRSKFLACQQGKRDLHGYVQELRLRVASMASDPLPEAVKVTVFMEGLKPGPARTQLFRANPSSLEEAMEIAVQEDYCFRQARGPTPTPNPSGATPMDINGMESVKCFRCGKTGHMRRNCPRNSSQTNDHASKKKSFAKREGQGKAQTQ